MVEYAEPRADVNEIGHAPGGSHAAWQKHSALISSRFAQEVASMLVLDFLETDMVRRTL